MAERLGTNIQILGVKATVAALRAFEPDLLKSMNAEIRDSLKVIEEGAKSRYPKGAWSLRLNAKKILGTIVAAGGGMSVDAYKASRSSWSKSPAGKRAAIFEFAGSRGPGKTPQAQGLIQSLNDRYGAPGRFLWSSWDARGGWVLGQIEESVKRAERDLQANLDSAGERY